MSVVADLSPQDKRRIAAMILEGDAEGAIRLASEHYGISKPDVRIGLPKRESRVYACYQARNKTIYFADGEVMRNPFVVMHEFYHHLRTHQGQHRGTEKRADSYALTFLQAIRGTWKRPEL